MIRNMKQKQMTPYIYDDEKYHRHFDTSKLVKLDVFRISPSVDVLFFFFYCSDHVSSVQDRALNIMPIDVTDHFIAN